MSYITAKLIQFSQWAAKQPERHIEFFGGPVFMWMILGPGFAFIIGLALYYISQGG